MHRLMILLVLLTSPHAAAWASAPPEKSPQVATSAENQGEERETAEAPAPEATAAGADRRSQDGPADPGETVEPAKRAVSVHAKIWWNQEPKIEVLTLSAEQRTDMDAALDRFLDLRREAISRQRQSFSAFGDALAAGDEEEIRRRGDALAAAMAAPSEGQVELMIEVTSLLSAEQRGELHSRFPKLLSRRWIGSGRLEPRRGRR